MNATEKLLESLGKRIAYLKTMDESVEVAYEIEEIQSQALVLSRAECEWKWDEEKKRWHTGCRAYHYSAFDKDETMRRLRFCPFCAHKIKEPKP